MKHSATLAGKRILLGVCGGIAAYKAAEVLRLLRKEEARVRVVMTESAQSFVGPLTFEALSGEPVFTDMFSGHHEDAIRHIQWADWADVAVVAPCTANVAAKMAHGMADDALTTVLLAVTSPVMVCPSMNTNMFEHPATRSNLKRLVELGMHVMAPGEGFLACGWTGAGRLPEPPHIVDRIKKLLAPPDLAGKTVLVTAGPTREPMDPVRYVSNPSSGKMGFAIARAAEHRGAKVVLVTGPVALDDPLGVEVVRVGTAEEMRDAVMERISGVDIVVKSAAVSDYKPVDTAEHKVKKKDGGISIEMGRTPDILQELGANKPDGMVLVGFAAETRELEKYATEKIRKKNLDMIVANLIGSPGSGFGTETNQVTCFYSNRDSECMDMMSKDAVAHAVLDRAMECAVGGERTRQ
ncbi:MAG: bifunctional phosphopantothenoylcysteine decarboxylase/phosphopantothenate--cysteine ligase CoaBC [Desulfatibacillaceae bacterium]